MADDLDDGEFWLPPQFLTDDDLLMDFKSSSKKEKNDGTRYVGQDMSNGFGFLGPCSELSSPVESVGGGSTETESDEDDYITGLTRKMARSTLQETGFGYENSKGWGLSGSPQSTLCNPLVGWDGNRSSSRGSPNCQSRASSPPGRKFGDGAWDLLYAAAGEVARMRMIEESAGFYSNQTGAAIPPRKPSPISVPSKNPDLSMGFQTHQPNLSYQQLQIAQFQQLKQQQEMLKQKSIGLWAQGKGGCVQYHVNQTPLMPQSRAKNSVARPVNTGGAGWPTLQQSQQQQPGSGMRAVFLGNTGTKRECTGTGVFLPRRFGTPAETRKKPACSTVLLPDRVVQALNLNLESVDAQSQMRRQPKCSDSFTLDYDAAINYRNNVAVGQQRRNLRQPTVNEAIRLPQDWTY